MRSAEDSEKRRIRNEKMLSLGVNENLERESLSEEMVLNKCVVVSKR